MGCVKGRKRQRSGHGGLTIGRTGTKGQQLSSDEIRNAAMTSKAWPYEEARKLLKRWPDGKTGGEPMLFETGYGPSGLPHLGTFQEVSLSFASSSRFSVPLSTRRMAPMEATNFDSDAA